MDQDKTVIFEKFAKQAAKRMEERKKHRKESLKTVSYTHLRAHET